ncbi:MAG: hypothetical protein U1F77_01755 [Kiritimatiellia bacterium]
MATYKNLKHSRLAGGIGSLQPGHGSPGRAFGLLYPLVFATSSTALRSPSRIISPKFVTRFRKGCPWLYLAIARGSAGLIRSMCLVVRGRKNHWRFARPWTTSGRRPRMLQADHRLDRLAGESDIQGKRHQTPRSRRVTKAETAVKTFRDDFLLGLKPSHPLFNTREAPVVEIANSVQLPIGGGRGALRPELQPPATAVRSCPPESSR